MMIPVVSDEIRTDFEFEELPTNTWELHIEENKIYGFTDKLEAMKQAIYLILSIERYEYIIFSWNYGIELLDLYGREMTYVIPELERRIKEALLQDTRITSVENFEFETEKGVVKATFTAKTIYGDVETEKVVNVNV